MWNAPIFVAILLLIGQFKKTLGNETSIDAEYQLFKVFIKL